MEKSVPSLNQRLCEARLAAGVTALAASDALGTTVDSIYLLEAGGRSVSTLELWTLAKLYGRTINSFFDGVVDKPPLDSERLAVARAEAAEAMLRFIRGHFPAVDKLMQGFEGDTKLVALEWHRSNGDVVRINVRDLRTMDTQ